MRLVKGDGGSVCILVTAVEGIYRHSRGQSRCQCRRIDTVISAVQVSAVTCVARLVEAPLVVEYPLSAAVETAGVTVSRSTLPNSLQPQAVICV